MRPFSSLAALWLAATVVATDLAAAAQPPASIQLGPQPYFLVDDMRDSPLKQELQACADERRSFR